MDVRHCEAPDCGMKLPPYVPRIRREDGLLVCPNCIEGRPGRPRAHAGLRQASVDGDFMRLLDRIRPGLADAYEADDYSESYDAIWDTLTPEEQAEINAADAERTRLLYGSSLRTVAHDSGDGKTIYHCPFCGAGQVVAGSDGTTECQFCHTFFTVQVQPEFAAFPQTINGQPVQVPGMPGDPTQPSPSPDGPTAGDDKNDPFQPPDQPDAFKPPDEPEPPDDKPNPFQGSRVERLYLVPEGVAIPEESYMRRLALEHAPDRDGMLADLRSGR